MGMVRAETSDLRAAGSTVLDRAFLWKHAGTELQRAGVLAPTTKPNFDVGSGTHGAWTKAMEKKLGRTGAEILGYFVTFEQRAIGKSLVHIGEANGFDWAADNMRHYLGNSGKTKSIDVDHLLSKLRSIPLD